MQKFFIKSKDEMISLAEKIAAEVQSGSAIALKGTLGAGKTFFAKHFINFLREEKGEVLSPTFNLVCSYDSKKGEIFHFDLYRLKDVSELENIGFFDALRSGICLIEWAEIAEKFLPKNYRQIEIKFASEFGEEGREIIII